MSCPLCQHETEPVFALRGVPVHSCLLFGDAESARRVERADLALRVCGSCGLGHNEAFDAGAMRYGQGYEGAQSASATFSTFSRGLAAYAARAMGLAAGSRVLDVGCGHGEFLADLAEVSGCAGVGIDPACEPARPPRAGVVLRRERLEEFGGEGAFDAVVCRHTLEHVLEVRGFLARLASRVREGGWALIEVPAAERIWAEGAFWDCYHEHATYWSAPALARAVAQAGLAVDLCVPMYEMQYLICLARRGDRGLWPRVAGGGAGTGASERLASMRQRWTARARAWSAEGPWAIWGAGSKAVAFLHATAAEPSMIVDLNPAKHGTHLCGSGRRVFSPESLRARPPARVLAMNAVYRDEIAASLHDLAPGAALHCLGDEP